MNEYTIRQATRQDLPQMLSIYAPYVENTCISFEYAPPSLEEFSRRFEERQGVYPWLVAQSPSGEILGYSYASPFAARQAFCISSEITIYLNENHRGNGLGKALYRPLIQLLQAQGYCSLYAIVATPNPASERFHEKLGFEKQAHLTKAGYKHNAFAGIAYYWLDAAPHITHPQPPIPFAQLDGALVESILNTPIPSL